MTRPEEWNTYAGAVKALSGNFITVYHGTTIPIEVIKVKGLQAHSVEAIRNFLDMRLRSLPYNLKRGRILELLPSFRRPRWAPFVGKGEWEIVKVTPMYEIALEYTVAPPEIITHWLSDILPRPLITEAVKALMEVSGGRVYGKVVTIELPTRWIPELVRLGPEIYIAHFYSRSLVDPRKPEDVLD